MTFVADVRTAQIADLVVIKDGSVADGAMANTLQVKVTDALQRAWRTDGQRDGRQQRNGHSDGHHAVGRYGGVQCHQSDGGS